ncbi:MAG: GDSL-type esterase/lipase family protein [Bdellovibrionota bacterium]
MKMIHRSATAFLSVCLFTLLSAPRASACPDIDGLADLNCDGRLEIICFGDSITFGEQDNLRLGYPGRLQASFLPDALIRNFGRSGENTSSGRSRAAQRFSQYNHSDYSIVLEGVNDYFMDNHSSSNTRSNLFSIVRSAANSGSVARLATLTDTRRPQQQPWVRSVNSAIRPNTTIDFFSLGQGIISSDKLHPNGNGYQLMATLAMQSLQAASAANRPRDTDGDGLYDFEETARGTNPNVADSDGDGLSDGQEVYTYKSNPLSLDSDGDGISDSVEATVRHTDPASPLPLPPTMTALQAIP